MRRNFPSELTPKMRLSGVIATVRLRKTSVSIPVVRVANSSGLGPTCLRYKLQRSRQSGMAEFTNTTNFANPRFVMTVLETPDEVHALVKMGHLFRVPVEQQSLAPAELSDAPFRSLAPARVGDRRVHVRIKTVLVRRLNVPRRRRLTLDQR